MVPMRMKESSGSYGVHGGGEVAAGGAVGARGMGGELQREGKRAVKGWGATRGCHGEQEVAGASPEQRAALRRWTEEAGREGGGRRSWTSL